MALADPIQIEEREVRGFAVLSLRQPTVLDSLNADDFAEAVSAVLARQVRIAIDCTNLETITSKGIGALILLWNRIKEKQGTLRLFGVNDRVTDIFQVTRMNTLFEVAPDEASAVS